MTQTALQRKYQRLAQAINTKAENLRAQGRVTAVDLAIIARDHPACSYCGIELEPGQGTFDHVVPFNHGGRNEPANLVRCCYACNRSKFTKTPDEHAQYLATTVECPVCETSFRPRWSQLSHGLGRFCSRSCAARSRWMDEIR